MCNANQRKKEKKKKIDTECKEQVYNFCRGSSSTLSLKGKKQSIFKNKEISVLG